MWRWRWRIFRLTLSVLFPLLAVTGAALIVVRMVVGAANWGLPVAGLDPLNQITHFLLRFPFGPKPDASGDDLPSMLVTAAMNIGFLATLGSLLGSAAITALSGFWHRRDRERESPARERKLGRH
jgi:hypothetical protein